MDHNWLDRMRSEINSCASPEHLHRLREQFHETLRSFPVSSDIEVTVDFTNQLHDAFIQRTITLSQAELAGGGMGPPPVSYAFILFGSGGRREQTLWSDQDNGLIYEDSDTSPSDETEAYFQQLSDRIAHNLVVAGYPPCEGNVLSTNPQWRKPVSGWKEMLTSWFERATWEEVRQLLIVADARSVYGNRDLMAEVKHFFIEQTLNRPYIHSRMLENTLRHKVLLGIFGNLIKEQYGEDAGGIDVKYGAYLPFVNGIRMLSILAGITETNTLERLRLLEKSGVWKGVPYSEWFEAFKFILKLRTMTTHHDEKGTFTTSGKLKAKALTKDIIGQLKDALKAGKELQKFVQRANRSSIEVNKHE